MWHLLKPGDDPLVDWCNLYGDDADGQGWCLFECAGDGHPPIELQMCDDALLFMSDLDAWEHVVRRAQRGDLACATALHVLAVESPDEHGAIVDHVHRRGHMKIISPDVDFDENLAELTKGYIVGITTATGERFDLNVEDVGRNEGGFVTLDGPLFTGDDTPGPHRSIALVDIDTLEVY